VDATAAAYLVHGAFHEASSNNASLPDLPRAGVDTFGLELAVELTPRCTFSGEAAAQWGRRGDQEVRAAASEARVEWASHLLAVSAHAAYATGDRPHTDGVYEGFTPMAQDVRGRWEGLGLLASSNCYLWGVGGRIGEEEACVRAVLTQAFADDPQDRVGLIGETGSGKDVGLFLTVSGEGRLLGEERARARVSWTVLQPGSYFEQPRDKASLLSIEVSAAF
jgi:hypothetical protein